MGCYKTEKPLPERAPYDFYPTARETVLDGLHAVSRGGFAPRRILDPGAGRGPWGQVARDRWPAAHITGVELQEFAAPAGYDDWLQGRFQDVAQSLGAEYDLVMGNPPYKDAEAFTRGGLALLAPGGRLGFLLNQSFQASQTRGWDLFQEHRPRWIFPCIPRPSFTGDRRTAAEEYAFYVWEQGFTGATQTIWLPKEEVAATWKRSGPGRPKVYPSDAEKQRAYRARRKVLAAGSGFGTALTEG